MGVKLGLVAQTFSPAEDWSWLGGEAGTLEAEPITLDGSAFTATFTDGVVPSGVVLAKITSSGLYAPYDGGVNTNEIQSIIATGGTVGDFTLAFEGDVTAAIAWNATAAAVEAALLLLPAFDQGDIVVAGGPLPETAVTVEFVAPRFAGENVPALVVADNITNGSATVTTPTPGASTSDGLGGLAVAKGHLFTTTDVGLAGAEADVSAALFWGPGSVIEANLPTNHGLDAEAKAALSHLRYR